MSSVFEVNFNCGGVLQVLQERPGSVTGNIPEFKGAVGAL